MSDRADEAGGCGAAEPYALRVLGDSMEPEFPDGSIILVDPAGVVEAGSYVIALHEDDYIFRRFVREGDGCYLEAENPGYPRIEVAGTEVVIGVVVQRAGTRRRHHKHYV